MTDFMFEVMELLEQGETVVAKMGEKADPQELAAAVLHYCEAAEYTISEVDAVMLALYRASTDASKECQRNTKFTLVDDKR